MRIRRPSSRYFRGEGATIGRGAMWESTTTRVRRENSKRVITSNDWFFSRLKRSRAKQKNNNMKTNVNFDETPKHFVIYLRRVTRLLHTAVSLEQN